MSMASMEIKLDWNQLLRLAKQLSDEDKIQFDKAFRAEVRAIKLKRLVEVFSSLNVDLSQEEIDAECEAVRQELYEKNYKE